MSEQPAGIGDNGQLRSIVERIEAISTEISERSDDRKEIYSEARGNGFNPAVLRKIVSIRKQDRDKRLEQEALLEVYLAALGMV